MLVAFSVLRYFLMQFHINESLISTYVTTADIYSTLNIVN